MKNPLHLFIYLPQGNHSLGEKRENIFEQFLGQLHNASLSSPVSLEILGKDGYAYFFITIEAEERKYVEAIVYANFPDAEIVKAEHDPLRSLKTFTATEIGLIRSDIFPIKNYTAFEQCSLSNIISVIEKSSGNTFIQIIIKKQGSTAIYHIFRRIQRKLFAFFDMFSPRTWFHPQIRATRMQGYKEAQEKIGSSSYKTSFRLAAENAEDLQALFRSFSPFKRTDINEFVKKSSLSRELMTERQGTRPFYCSFKELATLYHFPNADFTSHIVHMQSKRAEAPRDIPKILGNNVSFFGQTNYHGSSTPFGILQEDRRRHLYMVGKSGSGKSKCLELLLQEDIKAGRGFALMDPHGDLVDNVLRMIPESRTKDVIIFDPSDTEFPVAFNPIETVDSSRKMQVTIGFISIFKKLFGNTWTPRLEHVLRYTVLALLDSEGTTTLSILKMLTDKNYRQQIVSKIQDSIVKNFWVSEFAGWSEKFDAEAITPLLNKVGQFVATDLVRNIVGQPKSAFHIREIMDNQKILLVKVSKGLLGEENAGLLGAMFITKMYEAAMSRADIPEEQRKDFSLYVDEFQNFATDTFAEILSEARKYGLNLTIAHQYIGQLTPNIQKTVFGNVGSIISFRVGAADAKVLAEEYNPVFTERDIINLGVREFYAKLSVGGEIREAFSGKTLGISYPPHNHSHAIRNFSQKTYGTPKANVQSLLKKWDESGTFENESQGQVANFAVPII